MKRSVAVCMGILVGLTSIMAGLAIYFFYLWQAEISLRDKEVASLTKIIVGHMKTGEENFKWRQFVEKMGIETLLKRYWEIADSEKHNDIEIEIQRRLLDYGGNPVEPLDILIGKLLKKDSLGRDKLVDFVNRAEKTIRIFKDKEKLPTDSRPYIGISGSLFEEVTKGDWDQLLEQAVIFVKLNDGQVWLFNFKENGRRHGKFQSISVNGKCGRALREFTEFDYKCAEAQRYWSWDKIKKFLRGKMQEEAIKKLVMGVEDYLRLEKIL